MPIISIIMPVYNSSKFLSAAIESVLNQSFRDIELILIDDGSTDNSGEICELYKKNDERVLVIHQGNGGICSARNIGLECAQGVYIAFADNDDEYLDGLLEENYVLAKDHDADIVKYGVSYLVVDAYGNQEERHEYKLESGVYDSEKIVLNYKQLRSSKIFMFVWNALIKRSLIFDNSVKFDTNIKYGGEDCSFNYDCLIHTKKLVVSSKEYYKHYRRANHSTVLKFNFNKAESAIIMAEKERRWFLTSELRNIYPEYWGQLAASYLTSIIIITLDARYCASRNEKTAFLNDLRYLEQFSLLLKNIDSMRFLSKTKKFGLFALLWAKKKYRALLLLVNLYRIIHK